MSRAHNPPKMDDTLSEQSVDFLMDYTCESDMGEREEEGDGVDKDEGGGDVWPEDGDREEEEGGANLDEVVTAKTNH
jgi:hypothetical protein